MNAASLARGSRLTLALVFLAAAPQKIMAPAEFAASVGSYFTSHGVLAARIMTVGYGESHPIASNDTEAGRAQNRRVEVVFQMNEEHQP